MFFKRKGNLSDKAQVERIRKRLADYVSDGERTEFDITEPLEGNTVAFNSVEFKQYNVARINYDVTEWSDIEDVTDSTRTALKNLMGEDTTINNDVTEPTIDTDYWGTR